MKVITEEHYVPERRYTTTKYIATDGQEFRTEDDCLRHEKYLEIRNHPVFKSCITNVRLFDDEYCASLYYIRNKDDYDFLINHIGISKRDHIYGDFAQHGEGWYLLWCESGGNYYDDYNIYNYNIYEKGIEADLEEWKTKMHHLMINKGDMHELS